MSCVRRRRGSCVARVPGLRSVCRRAQPPRVGVKRDAQQYDRVMTTFRIGQGFDVHALVGADDAPVFCRPEVGAAIRHPGARGFESDRRAFFLAQRLPLQAVAQPGRSRALVQFLVDGLHTCRFHSRSQPSRHRPRRPTSRRNARQPNMFGRCCWRASTRG